MAKKLLIVDDNTETLETLTLLFKAEGYVVSAAQSVAECLTLLSGSKPDLILLDVILPDGMGTDFCLKLKQDIRYRDIIIVLLSGIKISSEDRLMGMEIGAIDYINRPLSNKELVAKINAIFGLREMLVQPRIEEAYNHLTETNTAVTAEAFEQINIWDASPEMFRRFTAEYLSLMKKQIDHRIYKTPNNVTEKLKDLAQEFGFLKAGPREVIEVHKKALSMLMHEPSAVKSYYVKEESRILLVEVLGYLLIYYRNKS